LRREREILKKAAVFFAQEAELAFDVNTPKVFNTDQGVQVY